MDQTTATSETLADAATAYALANGLNIVSDMFGKAFVVQKEGQQAFRVAYVNTPVKGRVTVTARDHPSLELALNYIKQRLSIEVATERIASLTDQEVAMRYCATHGVKVSDHSHGGYMTISRPIRDKVRNWQVAHRVGNTLQPLAEIVVRDRWGAVAKVTQLGGPEVTEVLTGPIKFPFGDSYSLPPKHDGRNGTGSRAA